MKTDPCGHAWWHWVIGIGVVVALVTLTAITGGLANAVWAPKAFVAITHVLTKVTEATIVSGGIGLVSGGINSLIHGESLSEGASKGFMWGTISGTLGELISQTSNLVNIGIGKLQQVGKFLTQFIKPIGTYIAQTLSEKEKFTIKGISILFFSGITGASDFLGAYSTQLILNILFEGLSNAIDWLKITIRDLFNISQNKESLIW